VKRDFSSARRPPASWLERALLGLGALALAWSALLAWRTAGQAQEVEGRIGELRAELARGQAALHGRRPLPGAEARLAERARLARQAPPGQVVEALAALLPEDVRLDGLALSYDDGRADLQLDVVAKDAAAYDLFLSRLAGSPRFREVRPGAESREGEVRCTVKVVYRGGTS
jgi:type II secretory pathway component PulL